MRRGRCLRFVPGSWLGCDTRIARLGQPPARRLRVVLDRGPIEALERLWLGVGRRRLATSASQSQTQEQCTQLREQPFHRKNPSS